jgi:hypothetical protein
VPGRDQLRKTREAVEGVAGVGCVVSSSYGVVPIGKY